LLKLATELRGVRQVRKSQSSHVQHVHYNFRQCLEGKIPAVSHVSSAVVLSKDVSSDPSLLTEPWSCEEFCTFLATQTSLAEEDLKLVYEYLTCTTSRVPSLLDIMETLVAGAPRLDGELQSRLQELEVQKRLSHREPSFSSEHETLHSMGHHDSSFNYDLEEASLLCDHDALRGTDCADASCSLGHPDSSRSADTDSLTVPDEEADGDVHNTPK